MMTNLQTLMLYLITILSTGALCAWITKTQSHIQQKYGLDSLGKTKCWRIHLNDRIVMAGFLPMIFLAGTRVDTGADYTQYVWNYAKVMADNDMFSALLKSREPLYVFLEYINKFIFGDNVYTWFFIMAALTLAILAAALGEIDRKLDYSLFAVLFGLYIYLHMFNYVRQLFAAALILLAIAYALDGKIIKALIVIAFATLMHRSSIVFLPILFVAAHKNIENIAFGRKYHLLVMVSPFFTQGVVYIIKKIQFLSIYASRYLSGSPRIGLGWLIDVLPVLALYFMNYQAITQAGDRKGKILAELSWLIIPVRVLSYYSYAAGRHFITFALLSITAFSLLINKTGHKRIKSIFAVTMLLMYFIFYFYLGNNSGVFPYASILLPGR